MIYLQFATYSFQPTRLGSHQFKFSMNGTESESYLLDLQSQNVTEVVVTNASGMIQCATVSEIETVSFCHHLILKKKIRQLTFKIKSYQICQQLSG